MLTAIPDSSTLIALALGVWQGMDATIKCHLLQKGKTHTFCKKIGHDLIKGRNEYIKLSVDLLIEAGSYVCIAGGGRRLLSGAQMAPS